MIRSKTRSLCRLLALVILIALPGMPYASAEQTASVLYVNNPVPTDRLNLREEANTTSKVLGRFYTGTVINETLGVQGDFTRVRIGQNEGYMQSSFLSSTRTDLELGTWLSVNVGSADEKLHLRGQPQEGALSFGLYQNGTAVQMLEDAGDYYRVRAVDQEGYMLKNYLQMDTDLFKPMYTMLTDGMVQSDTISLQAFPSREALSLGVYSRGQQLKVLGITGVWYYVEITGDDIPPEQAQRGFMLSQYLQVGNYGEPSSGAAQIAVVKHPLENERLHMRVSPMWSSDSMGTFFNTSQVLALDEMPSEGPNPTWVHVRIGEMEGYMQGEFLGLIYPTSMDTWVKPEDGAGAEELEYEEEEPILTDMPDPAEPSDTTPQSGGADAPTSFFIPSTEGGEEEPVQPDADDPPSVG